MKYASVCSGVEAASLAWMPLGWEAVWFSEIEPFPCAVLKERFPNVPNLGDMTKIKVENLQNGDQKYYGEDGANVIIPGGVDLLVGGTPCQAFSVSGNRQGIEDPRSALCLKYTELLGEIHPRWFVWENVPGVFSTNEGKDFKEFLRKVNEIGYSCAWRVLDAQYTRVDGFPFAIPQRRRRVFLVGHSSGDWRFPAAVLFEQEVCDGNTPPSRVKKRGNSRNFEERSESPVGTLSIGNGQLHTLQTPYYELAQTLDCMHDAPAILCYENHQQDNRLKEMNECCCTLNAHMGTGGNNVPIVQHVEDLVNFKPLFMRRFTPIECERLMGFPDNYTQISWRGKPVEKCPNNRRYKACGNSMCVNVMRWLGMRIDKVDKGLIELP